ARRQMRNLIRSSPCSANHSLPAPRVREKAIEIIEIQQLLSSVASRPSLHFVQNLPAFPKLQGETGSTAAASAASQSGLPTRPPSYRERRAIPGHFSHGASSPRTRFQEIVGRFARNLQLYLKIFPNLGEAQRRPSSTLHCAAASAVQIGGRQ